MENMRELLPEVGQRFMTNFSDIVFCCIGYYCKIGDDGFIERKSLEACSHWIAHIIAVGSDGREGAVSPKSIVKLFEWNNG